MPKCIRIERTSPRVGGDEFAIKYDRGYQLVAPGFSKAERNLVRNATFVHTLGEAADLLDRGYSLRMGHLSRLPRLITRMVISGQC